MPALSTTQRGSTLPEALAALLVVSVGLPGLGLLQLESLHTLKEASWQLIAVAAAVDIAESLRAGIPASVLAQRRPAGLPPAGRISLEPGAAGPPDPVRIRVEWPGHEARPASFELEVSR